MLAIPFSKMTIYVDLTVAFRTAGAEILIEKYNKEKLSRKWLAKPNLTHALSPTFY